MRIARGVSDIDYLKLRVKACPGAIAEGGNGVALRPASDGALDLLTFPSGEHDLGANPALSVLRTFAGFCGADGCDPGVHLFLIPKEVIGALDGADRNLRPIAVVHGDPARLIALLNVLIADEAIFNLIFHGSSLIGVRIYRLGQGVYTGQAHLETFPNVRFERVA
jgi:hypothetical protein